VLTPGEYRLVVPVVEANPAFFTFEIVPTDPNSREDAYNFRATTPELRSAWVKFINARIMDKVRAPPKPAVAQEHPRPCATGHPATVPAGRQVRAEPGPLEIPGRVGPAAQARVERRHGCA
jgi:hypothetical protein